VLLYWEKGAGHSSGFSRFVGGLLSRPDIGLFSRDNNEFLEVSNIFY